MEICHYNKKLHFTDVKIDFWGLEDANYIIFNLNFMLYRSKVYKVIIFLGWKDLRVSRLIDRYIGLILEKQYGHDVIVVKELSEQYFNQNRPLKRFQLYNKGVSQSLCQ